MNCEGCALLCFPLPCTFWSTPSYLRSLAPNKHLWSLTSLKRAGAPHVSAGAERGREAAPQRACRAARPSVTTQSPGVKAKPPKGSISCSNQQLKNINRCFSHLGESQQRIWMSLQSRAGTLWYVCEALLLVGEPHAGLSNTVLARAPRGLYLGALGSSRPSMPCSKRQRPIHSHQ